MRDTSVERDAKHSRPSRSVQLEAHMLLAVIPTYASSIRRYPPLSFARRIVPQSHTATDARFSAMDHESDIVPQHSLLSLSCMPVSGTFRCHCSSPDLDQLSTNTNHFHSQFRDTGFASVSVVLVSPVSNSDPDPLFRLPIPTALSGSPLPTTGALVCGSGSCYCPHRSTSPSEKRCLREIPATLRLRVWSSSEVYEEALIGLDTRTVIR